MAWSMLLTLHTLGALLALVIGPVNLTRKPHGDPFHKALGYTWAALMYWVAISSFWIREINHGALSPVHLLSVLTLVTLSLGIFFAIKRKMRAHRGMMWGTYLGLVGAFVGAVVPPVRAIPELLRDDPLTAYSWLGLVLLAAGMVLLVLRLGTARKVPGQGWMAKSGTERI